MRDIQERSRGEADVSFAYRGDALNRCLMWLSPVICSSVTSTDYARMTWARRQQTDRKSEVGIGGTAKRKTEEALGALVVNASAGIRGPASLPVGSRVLHVWRQRM